MTGPVRENLVGGLKLKGMTAFSTESSWCEKAMPPAFAG
ncbi:phosphomannomutase [Pseudomonas mandelii JR-1]|uniref:Phosphomannomutase n=1 Tax=Pseudomonas mandelii JR-1 TaxID=1147786 RepID=A0A024EDP6_9PSED|nr:phosphomannomutase [Pseudomonas mandelii JR-1]